MSKHPLAIVILAAGKGQRMQSSMPKSLHALAGLPMINWLLQTAESLSPEKIVVVVSPNMAELEDTIKPHVTVVQPKSNGTGGAVKVALLSLQDFTGDVLILLGDTPLISKATLEKLIATRHAGDNTALSILGAVMENPAGYGRLVLKGGDELQEIVEDKDASETQKQINLVNTGAFCIDGARLAGWVEQIDNKNAQGEFYITDLPAIAAKDGALTKVCATNNPAEVQGCNTRMDLAALEQTVQNRLRFMHMQGGVSMTDPVTVYLHHDTAIAPGVLIEPNVFFGPGVSIAEGVHIKAFCHIEGAQIGKDTTIGPFARLRPGSEIGEEVRIGNFVEVKKSQIGDRSKISHLGYVGDTVMGEDVNFSCGAITVNYDGFEKHQTMIGKGAMIGSNVNLVAPISIDDGAFLAAGSTITEDVPADSLSIARHSAEIRQGWAAEYRKRKKAIVEKLKKKKAS